MSSTFAEPETTARPRTQSASLAWKALKALASLRLTVALFAFSLVLVFYGTLAQIDKGIWTVVDEYFRSWYVWVPMQLNAEFGKKFFELPPDKKWGGSFLLPGGWLLGGIMLGNLVAAHLVRFKLSWRRSGIIILHAGVIVLMLGELITGMYAVESRMVLQIGETTNFIDHSRNVELAITEPVSAAEDKVVTIPQSMLRDGARINENLPFEIEVVKFHKNTDLRPTSGGDDSNTVVRIDGIRYEVVPASEEAGVKSDREDAAGVRIKLLRKGTDQVLAEHFFSLWEYDNYNSRSYMSTPFELKVDGKTYRVQLRNERLPTSFTVELKNFEHKLHAGTRNPKDFASTVTLVDPEMGTREDIRIWMNHPLYHRGMTFYQASTVYGDTGTVLQVVRNPGRNLPYISCLLVALGMMIHFGLNLTKFVGRAMG